MIRSFCPPLVLGLLVVATGCDKLKKIADKAASDAKESEDKKVAGTDPTPPDSGHGSQPPPNPPQPKTTGPATVADCFKKFHEKPAFERKDGDFVQLVKNIERLKAFDQVKTLDIKDTQISTQSSSLIAKFTSLNKLVASGIRQPLDAKAIGSLVHLESLDLHTTPTNDSHVAAFSNLDKVSFLNLANTQITDAGLAAIGEMKGLKSLNVGSNSKILGTGFQGAAWKIGPKLEILNVSATSFGVSGPQSIGKNALLKELYAASCSLNDADAQFIGTWRHLEKIDMGNNQALTDLAAKFIAALPAYKDVIFNHNKKMTYVTVVWFAKARNRGFTLRVNATAVIPRAIPDFLKRKPNSAIFYADKLHTK